jgi:hypothetical protein
MQESTCLSKSHASVPSPRPENCPGTGHCSAASGRPCRRAADIVARDALAVRVEHLAAQALALREGRTSFPSQVRSPRRNTVSETAGAGAGWRFDRLCVLWGYTINTFIIAPTSSLHFSSGGRRSTKGARSDGQIDQRTPHRWRFRARYDNVFVPFPRRNHPSMPTGAAPRTAWRS